MLTNNIFQRLIELKYLTFYSSVCMALILILHGIHLYLEIKLRLVMRFSLARGSLKLFILF